MKLSCGRRRSRLAVRTIRQMNSVEQNEERDLEDEQNLVDRGRVEDHLDSWLNATSVEPSVIVSPSLSLARFTRLPLTSIPFVEPRSTIQ